VARVAPIPPRQWPPEMRAALAAMVPPEPRHPRPISEGRPKGLNLLGALAHHPAAARAFLTFNGHVMMATTLRERQRELLVLRTAVLLECDYEWAQHVLLGRDAGLTDDEVAQIAEAPDAPSWDPLDAALLRATGELVTGGAIGAATWEALAGELDERQLMDVVLTVGAYQTLAWLVRSFEVEMDADLRGGIATGIATGNGTVSDRQITST
jgi:alkylhydroperoxidase family enzyme